LASLPQYLNQDSALLLTVWTPFSNDDHEDFRLRFDLRLFRPRLQGTAVTPRYRYFPRLKAKIPMTTMKAAMRKPIMATEIADVAIVWV